MLRGRSVDLEAVHTSSIPFGRLAWEFPFARPKCSVRSPTLLNRRSRMSLGNSSCSDEDENIAASPPHPAQYIYMRKSTSFFAIAQ